MAEMLNREAYNRQEQVRVDQQDGVVRREHIVRDHAVERRYMLFRISELIWLMTGILDGLIGLRFMLKLIAANPNSPFAQLIYNVTALFLVPFEGLTATPSAGGMVLEIPALIAMLVYVMAAWVVIRLIWVLFDPSSGRSHSTYERY
jgi:hypothetical protein